MNNVLFSGLIMQVSSRDTTMRTLINGLFVFLFCSCVQAMPATGHGQDIARGAAVPTSNDVRAHDQTFNHWQHLAENSPETKTPEQPESGSLVIPGEDEDKKEQKCLNVCKKWGENCIINPRTGNRDCRRTCKEFGEECF